MINHSINNPVERFDKTKNKHTRGINWEVKKQFLLVSEIRSMNIFNLKRKKNTTFNTFTCHICVYDIFYVVFPRTLATTGMPSSAWIEAVQCGSGLVFSICFFWITRFDTPNQPTPRVFHAVSLAVHGCHVVHAACAMAFCASWASLIVATFSALNSLLNRWKKNVRFASISNLADYFEFQTFIYISFHGNEEKRYPDNIQTKQTPQFTAFPMLFRSFCFQVLNLFVLPKFRCFCPVRREAGNVLR